jgi:hypothetical protein
LNSDNTHHDHDTHPRICVSNQEKPGLRSLAQVRMGLKQGHAADLYQRLLVKVDAQVEQAPWTPQTPLPGRNPSALRRGDREFFLVANIARRIEDASLIGLLTGDRKYADSVLAQIRSIMDVSQWPDIEDLSHLKGGDICSLRRGMLAGVIGLAFDWLHALLTPAERGEIIQGFDDRFTSRFRQAVEGTHCRWLNRHNNFIPCILGGFETAAIALGNQYPQSNWIIQFTRPRMAAFVENLIGEQGEFNESVQYAGSASDSVQYLNILRYVGAASLDIFRRCRLPQFSRWYGHMILPPGRVVGFGDPAPDMPPVVDYFSTLACAERDGVAQWIYLQYVDTMLPTHRRLAMELLGYDATLEPTPPDGLMPLGKVYHAQGKLIISRNGWNSVSDKCIVYSKAGREHSHGHPDWGQVCIDGLGERLIVDLGSTRGYPTTGKEFFYNFQQHAHNVLVIGQTPTGGVSYHAMSRQAGAEPRQYPQGRTVWSRFDDAVGGAWLMDLTPVYPGVSRVRRAVLHLLPGIVVVLDEATLESSQDISLRWHTAQFTQVAPDGAFGFEAGAARLTGRVVSLEQPISRLQTGRHEYREPHTTSRTGDLYPQLREPYVEARLSGTACRLLTLFAVDSSVGAPVRWEHDADGWTLDSPQGRVVVSVDRHGMRASAANGSGVSLPLDA